MRVVSSTYLRLLIISPGNLAHTDHREAVECRFESHCPTACLPTSRFGSGCGEGKASTEKRPREKGCGWDCSFRICQKQSKLEHTQCAVCQVTSVMSDSLQLYGAHQTSLSMGFSRQEHWNGLPCPPPGDLYDPGIYLVSLMSPALAGGFFTTGPGLPLIPRVRS